MICCALCADEAVKYICEETTTLFGMEGTVVRCRQLDHFIHCAVDAPEVTQVLVLEHDRELEDSVLIALEDWSSDDRQRMFKFRHREARTSWCVSRFLYRRVLAEACGCPEVEAALRLTSSGKPYLPDTTKRFNWSHTAGCVVLAIGDGSEVGCDVENATHILDGYQESMHAHFTAEERRWVEQAHAETAEWRRFVTLFVQKEAILKMDGRGLTGSLSDVHCILEDAPFRNGNLYCFVHGLANHYITAVSTDSNARTVYQLRMHRLRPE